MGEPLGRALPLVCLLQLLPDSPILARDSCDGSGDHGSRVGLGGIAGVNYCCLVVSLEGERWSGILTGIGFGNLVPCLSFLDWRSLG
jgi:hypothetical protein